MHGIEMNILKLILLSFVDDYSIGQPLAWLFVYGTEQFNLSNGMTNVKPHNFCSQKNALCNGIFEIFTL